MTIPKDRIIQIYQQEYLLGVSTVKLGKKYSVDPAYFNKWFKKLSLPTRNNTVNSRKYSFNEAYFNSIDTAEKAYWLGFIFADGYILSKRKHEGRKLGISLGIVDRSHLEKFVMCISGNVKICDYKVSSGYKPDTPYCRVILSSDNMVKALKSYGVVENKSNICKPPQGISHELERHFIRGYYDGDGSIWKQTNDRGVNTQYNIGITATSEILNYIMDVCIRDGALQRRYPLTKRKPEHTTNSIKFGGNKNVQRFLDYLYKDSTIHLVRKYDKYLQLKELIHSRLR